MDDAEKDRRVVEAFRSVDDFGAQVSKLLRELKNQLSSEISERRSRLQMQVRSSRDDSDSRIGSGDWVYVAEATSIGLDRVGPGKRSEWAPAYICLEAVLAGDGLPSGVAAPLLHVHYWDYSVTYEDGDDQLYLSFPMEDRPEIVAERLLVWRDGEWNAKGNFGCPWTYSLRLLALEQPENLRRYVLDPVLKLLERRDGLLSYGKFNSDLVVEALPDDWLDKVLLRYRPEYLDREPATDG
jgi:hypothetical protein